MLVLQLIGIYVRKKVWNGEITYEKSSKSRSRMWYRRTREADAGRKAQGRPETSEALGQKRQMSPLQAKRAEKRF